MSWQWRTVHNRRLNANRRAARLARLAKLRGNPCLKGLLAAGGGLTLYDLAANNDEIGDEFATLLEEIIQCREGGGEDPAVLAGRAGELAQRLGAGVLASRITTDVLKCCDCSSK